MSEESELLIEQVTSAHRALERQGHLQAHPAWHDLDDAGRQAAFEATAAQRTLESALAPDGLSSTGRAVLARIRGY